MSGRSRMPPHAMKGPPPPVYDPPPPPFGRGLGPMHPTLFDDLREPPPFGRGPSRHLPPHPAIIEERLAAQLQEIQALLVDNQRLAATHVALKQELSAVQLKIERVNHSASHPQAGSPSLPREPPSFPLHLLSEPTTSSLHFCFRRSTSPLPPRDRGIAGFTNTRRTRSTSSASLASSASSSSSSASTPTSPFQNSMSRRRAEPSSPTPLISFGIFVSHLAELKRALDCSSSSLGHVLRPKIIRGGLVSEKGGCGSRREGVYMTPIP